MKSFARNRIAILKKWKIDKSSFLGKGVESFVYSYNKNRVVRIMKNGNLEYLRSLKKLQELIAESGLSVKTPLIEDICEDGGTVYTIEKRLEGENLSKIFDGFDDKQKEIAILNYFDQLNELAKVDVDKFNFGQILETKDKISEVNWQVFLNKKVRQKTNLVRGQIKKDVFDFGNKLYLFTKYVDERLGTVRKNLVHGDYFYDNVMANTKQEITGVLDFSGWTTVVGDFRLDICGSIIFLEHSKKFIEYQQLLLDAAKKRFGRGIEWYIDLYRIYYSFFLSDSYLYLRPLYDWCIKNLNDEQLWRRLE